MLTSIMNDLLIAKTIKTTKTLFSCLIITDNRRISIKNYKNLQKVAVFSSL